MASVEAIRIPKNATSLHIEIKFALPTEGVKFQPAEATVPIQPADQPSDKKLEKKSEEKSSSGE